MMDNVPMLLKCLHANDAFVTTWCDFVLNLSYTIHTIRHISLLLVYLYLIAHFITFDLLISNCLNVNINNIFITICCDFVLNLSYTMHVTCHIHYLCFTYVFLTNKLYLCLIIHFITFNLLLFDCLNDRARIAHLMF